MRFLCFKRWSGTQMCIRLKLHSEAANLVFSTDTVTDVWYWN